MNLENKVAIVTGGNQGIGYATAVSLAAAGANVVIMARNTKINREAVNNINGLYPGKASAEELDVTSKVSVKTAFERVYLEFGHLDILVNNAGICNLSQPFENIDEDKWDQVMDVNLKGILNCVKTVIPIFKKQNSGKIINVASLAGEVGGIATSADYVASKAAVIGLTKSLARYLGQYNVNVNAVAPGFIDTEMTKEMSIPMNVIPLRCVGKPQDVADGITFLASERSRYITGTTLDINGGVFMK
ncbi:MAG: SDR family NAD(P)-dependent oxidoreductase [Acidaminococcaceae bacterium]